MKIGTKSVLFGAHQFIIHPLLLFLGWWLEYGSAPVVIGHRYVWKETHLNNGNFFRYLVHRSVRVSIWNPRLWIAFFVHDLGYWGKPNMDGPEGESHPEFGARLMQRWFGEPWGELVLLHSRYYAKRLGKPVSPLCYADKRVIVIEPFWLYLPRVWATGELAEFMAVAKRRGDAYAGASDPLLAWEASCLSCSDPRCWNRGIKSYMRRWLAEHKDGKPDSWTRVREAA